MRPRAVRIGRLLPAGLLLALLGPAAPAAGQQQDLEVDLRNLATGPGRLETTIALSGPAWGDGQRLTAGSFTATFDGRPADVTGATPLQEQQGSRGRLSVFLAVDTSGSMLANDNITTARAAAANFASKMRPGTSVGVISFADAPAVVQGLTSDRAQVQAAIERLAVNDPQGDTALFDAVRLAARELAGQPGARSLVVLSDGKHEGTATTFGQALAEAKRAKVIIDTVGLEVPGFEQDLQALERLGSQTNGTAVPASAANLVDRLTSLGGRLASQYVVTMALPPGLGSQADFRLQVRANGAEGVYENPSFLIGPQASQPPPVPATLRPAPALSWLETEQGRYLIALTGFFTVLLVALLVLAPRHRGGKPLRALRQRMSPYSLTRVIADEPPPATAFGSSEWAGRATAMAETLVRRGNLEETFLDRLEAAGLNMRVAEFVLISLGSAFIPPLLVMAVTRNLLLTVAAVLLGTLGPFLFLAVKASRRQAAFDEQLPSTLQLLAGALQAGHSLQQAVDTVVHEAGEPIAGEFQRVLTEARLGRPLDEAFEAMAKRTRSVDFEWTVMAIRLQRQVGGNLAEVLATVAQTIRERYSLKRQVRALSAEGRMSSLILSVLPVLMFAALLLFNPDFLAPLFTTALGLAMLAGAAVLMIVGVFWLKKLTEIKV